MTDKPPLTEEAIRQVMAEIKDKIIRPKTDGGRKLFSVHEPSTDRERLGRPAWALQEGKRRGLFKRGRS